jgi:hypothetical protein
VSHDVDITEVSDPRDLTIDEPTELPAPVVKVLKGKPSDAELAALITVLAGASGGTPEPGPQELNRWGHPVDKLRYPVFSWQNVTLVERAHLRK